MKVFRHTRTQIYASPLAFGKKLHFLLLLVYVLYMCVLIQYEGKSVFITYRQLQSGKYMIAPSTDSTPQLSWFTHAVTNFIKLLLTAINPNNIETNRLCTASNMRDSAYT
jgi:hypothetical protein